MFLHLFIYCTYVHSRVQALWHEGGGLKTAPGGQFSPVTMQFPGMELRGFSGNHLASPPSSSPLSSLLPLPLIFPSLFLTSLLPLPLTSLWLSVAVRGPPEVLVTGFPCFDTVARLLGQWTSWNFASFFLPPAAEHWDQKHTLSCLASHGLWALYPVRSSVCEARPEPPSQLSHPYLLP